jgi:hypothetical protein
MHQCTLIYVLWTVSYEINWLCCRHLRIWTGIRHEYVWDAQHILGSLRWNQMCIRFILSIRNIHMHRRRWMYSWCCTFLTPSVECTHNVITSNGLKQWIDEKWKLMTDDSWYFTDWQILWHGGKTLYITMHYLWHDKTACLQSKVDRIVSGD